MYKVIQRFCNDDKDNGLLLLDMPTGSGKTFSVLKYIFDSVKDNRDGRKYFFITTLKKNLPIDDLRKNFEDAGELNLFKEKFIFVDSNLESVISGLTKEVIDSIPNNIKKSEEYKNLELYSTLIQDSRGKKNKGDQKKFLIALEDKLRTEIEPCFRRYLQNELSKAYPMVQDRKNAIKTEKKWRWVEKLYPSVFLKEKRIIFMSVDKFLSQISTIVEPSCMLYNSTFIDKAVIFIDEFDSAKETILKNIIQNGLHDRVDYISLFKNIYASLHTHKVPKVLTTPSEWRKKGEYKDQSLESIINGIIEKADEIYRIYNLQFSHKTESTTDENINNFLFQDHQYLSILNGNKSYISSISDSTRNINIIKFTEDKLVNETSNIQVMLGKLRGFISYFLGGVNILALNYQQIKAENRKTNENEFSLESSIRTILAEFGLDDLYINYLTSQSLISSRKEKGNIEGSEFDLSFYENGFRYYAFEDDYSHDTMSKIMMYSFQKTPEKLVLRFCEKAKVIGISATATVPTALGNFDLEYFQEKLQDKYSKISIEEKNRLDDDFKKSISMYDKVNINAKLLGNNTYSKKTWLEIVEKDELAEYLFDLLEKELPDDEKSYNKIRYSRIGLAFKEFIVNTDIMSFLCVLTKHPRNGDKYLDKEVLDVIFKIICKQFNNKFDFNKQVVQLDGDEYDSKKDEIINRLGQGEKLFVISVYQTIGAGQNLQYPIPKELRKGLVKINDYDENTHKDFDAIYLDMPTNLIVPIDNNLSDEDFVKYIFQMEMLQEASELSAKETKALIKRAFRAKLTNSQGSLYDTKSSKPNDCPSTILLSTRLIIQALGRICRTNMKSKNIYIFADNRIAERIDLSVRENRNFNCEFIELLNKISLKAKSPKYDSLEDAASLTSIRVNKFIRSLMPNRGNYEDWTDDKISKWKELRELVLKSPTMSCDEIKTNFTAYNFYVKLPKNGNEIYYHEENDFNNISISFEKSNCDEHIVSEEACKLTKLMRIDLLRRYFEKHGWATSFKQNDYIMSPPLFNNIYRGALGEVVGKALFYKYANINLEEITDNRIFEFFDYKMPNAPIYVDFKNWHESTNFDDKKMTEKIILKAKECQAKYVIIANVIANSCHQIRKKKIDGIELLILPSLLLEDKNNEVNSKAIEEITRCIHEFSA